MFPRYRPPLTCHSRHEHLYHKVESKIIRSDEFADDIVGMERLLGGAQVILCTLSMFSNPRLQRTGCTRIVPVHTVIVDEASQIGLGDYFPLWSKFGENMKKMVFIGDDKQRQSFCPRLCLNGVFTTLLAVAPYGQDDLGDLRSIFEVQHLRQRAVFLDTQCMSSCLLVLTVNCELTRFDCDWIRQIECRG